MRQAHCSNDQFIFRINVLEFQQYFVDIVGIRGTLKHIANDLKNVFYTLRIVYISIDNKLKRFGIAEESQLQVAIVIKCFVAARRNKTRWRCVQLAGNFVKQVLANSINCDISQVFIHRGKEPVTTNTPQRVGVTKDRTFIIEGGMLHLRVDVQQTCLLDIAQDRIKVCAGLAFKAFDLRRIIKELLKIPREISKLRCGNPYDLS